MYKSITLSLIDNSTYLRLVVNRVHFRIHSITTSTIKINKQNNKQLGVELD